MVITTVRKADQVSPAARETVENPNATPSEVARITGARKGPRRVSGRQTRRMVLIGIASAFITFTTSPVCGAWTTMPLPMYIPTWCMSPP